MSFFKKSSNFWVDEHGNMTSHEPEREVLMSRDNTDSDSDDNDSVLFDKTKVVTIKGQGSYKTDTKCPVWRWTIGLCVLLISAILTFLIYINYNILLPDHWTTKARFNKTADWMVTLAGHGSESCVRLVDVDGDGRDDIIFAMFSTKYFSTVMSMKTKAMMKKMCLDAEDMFPCAGKIVALRGYDGKELWRTSVYMAPFEINCNVDVDGDGKLDCIAAGRMGTLVAFNPRNGTVLWRVDESVVHWTWNFYNVLVMPDFTADGVPELLLSHGGDPTYKAKDLKRAAGRLILVNGRTGHSLGRVLQMSKYKETYMSPALHTTRDGSQYVLYGQGGETARGDFLGISVPDLYRYVKNLTSSTPVANTRGSYTGWKNKVKYLKHGVFVIYRCQIKGVMVTPTLVDMNGDGIHDIVMSAYDGTIRLYNGETLEIIWTAKFPDLESYSTLAPGYFNDDDTLDFMFHMNIGAWPKYQYSQTFVIDGTNGEVLWRLNVSQYEMTSDLVARTTENYRDAFVFQVKGVNYPASKQRKTRRSRLHDNIKKRDLTGTPVIYKEGDANFTNLMNMFNKTDMNDLETLTGHGNHYTAVDAGDLGKESQGDGDVEYSDPEMDKDHNDNSSDSDAVVVDDGDEEVYDDEHYPDCTEDMLTYTTELFLLDRSNVHSPNVLLTLPSVKLYYSVLHFSWTGHPTTAYCSKDMEILTEKYDAAVCDNVTDEDGTDDVSEVRRSVKTQSCIILKNDERTTGVLGDVDGDGNLDVISIIDGEGEKKNVGHGAMSYTLRIVKTNLVDALAMKGRYSSKLDLYVSEKMRDVHGIKPIEDLKFRPLSHQPWTQYLGRKGDYIYNKQG